MADDPILEALTRQVECYRRLSKLAAVQHEHVKNNRTEELLMVLTQAAGIARPGGRPGTVHRAGEKGVGAVSLQASGGAADESGSDDGAGQAVAGRHHDRGSQRHDGFAAKETESGPADRKCHDGAARECARTPRRHMGIARRPWICKAKARPMETVAEKPSPAGHHDTQAPSAAHAKRIEDLGRIILAYSDVTDKLQKSHVQLEQTVQTLREELSAKNRELSRRERMAALGEMAAGMAHEIRNPLGGIQLYASMLADDLQDMPEALELAQKITAGVKRLESLVGQVLQFTREMQAHPVESDLAQIIEQAIELAGERIGPRGTECLAEGPRPMVVRVDPLMMGQAVLNLLINAVEALGGRRRSADRVGRNRRRALAAENPRQRAGNIGFGAGKDFPSIFQHQGDGDGAGFGDRAPHRGGARWGDYRG